MDGKNNFSILVKGDSTKKITLNKIIESLKQRKKKKVQLAILHPPYFDIIKFSQFNDDLSNAKSLEDFLKNNSKGYRLENSHSTGIQVHPFPEINSRSSRSYSGYPHIAVNLYGERPAVLTGRIDGKFLTGAPVKEEAGIKSTNIEHIKNPKITELPVSQFSDTYKTQAIQHAITNNLPIDKFLNEDLPNADKEFRRQFRRRTAF